MSIFLIEMVFVALVVLGSVTIVWGVRHFQLSSRTLAFTFALTAVSWLAFLVTTISFTVKLLVLSNV